jgi:hypothetical protein
MGYVARPTYRQVEWGFDASSSDSLAISSVAGDIGPFTGTLPDWSGNIILAYMDILVGQVQNGAAGANNLWTTTYVQLKKNGGSYANAHKFAAGQFTMSINDKMTVGRLYGNINIASTINAIGSGGAYTWQWHDAKAASDFVYIKGAFHPILRVVFQ